MSIAVTAFDRHQEILKILRQQSSARVTDLAKSLGVSQVTVRSDLDALEEEGLIERVRGGAVLKDGYHIISPMLAARAQVNETAKQRIAHRAVDMVEDGDLILLDAGTTVFHMVSYLRRLNNLTIVTNGIEAGLALARDTSHTVILLGGVLEAENAAVVGPLGESNLRQLHIKTAFLSCSGFSLEKGMTSVDMHEAQLKRQMVNAADRVVALVDSSKFGKADLTPFARLDQISHVITDSNITPHFVEKLRQSGITVIVCGQNTVSSYVPLRQDETIYKIGFANLSEDQSPFAVDVRHGLELAAQRLGNIDLIMADNRLDSEVALKVADNLVAKGVHLAIEYQIDEHVGGLIASKFHEAGIPVIAVDIPMVGATYFGVDNYRAGHMAGLALGRWIEQCWQGQIDGVLVLQSPRAGALPAARVRGQLEGLGERLGPIAQERMHLLNGGNTIEGNEKVVSETLAALSQFHRIAVLAINDNAAIGALRAAQALRRARDIAIVGQGADRQVRREIRRADSPVVGATAFWPESYGEKLMDVATKILRGEPVPPAVYVQHVFLEAGNIDHYYPNDGHFAGDD